MTHELLHILGLCGEYHPSVLTILLPEAHSQVITALNFYSNKIRKYVHRSL